MNFDLTEDQREIRRTARDFLAARYTPEKIRAIALDGQADPHWDEIVELGWPGIAEFGIVELAVVAEQLGLRARADAAGRHLGRAAAARGRRAELEGRGTVAMWDEDGSADPESPTLKAEDGKLTGVKIAVPNADVADVLVVTAEGGRHFAVPARPTRRSSRPRALDATRPLFTVRFDGTPGEELTGRRSAAPGTRSP